ncbi:N-acetylmuramoyl-L-alanine amidase [Nioella aestuarii]|uniref:N-acetylmuramoyl-L-alanine amidase n=1 Tax=Nioella aestuarii TaxID=1662864 RepID=UPI003D7F8C23
MPAAAQDLRALARVLADDSRLEDDGRDVVLDLSLTQAVPYRVFVLDEPERVVLDFREVNWAALGPDFDDADQVTAVAMGRGDAGWSRMVLSLDRPMEIAQAGMETDDTDGTAHVRLRLSPVSADEFAELAAHTPPGVRLPPVPVADTAPPARPEGGPIMIALDPGHGGVDPGAQRRGQDEADLMLVFAIELREVLLRSGLFDVVLTREGDWFVSLPERVTIARSAGAQAFLSLHADALEAGRARGATVYTLSETASDAASEALAEAHDRADLLAGVDLAGSDDEVAGVLLDLARLENAPRSEALADHIVAALDNAGANLHRHPRLEAGFSVLKAADIPSVLIELGFLSDAEDLANLMDATWREQAQEAIRDALVAWAAEDQAQSALLRQ